MRIAFRGAVAGVVAAATFGAAAPSHAQESCAAADASAVARLETVAAGARLDDFARVLHDIRAAWAAGDDHKDALDAAVVDVGQWGVLSAGLTLERACRESATRTIGEFRNSATGAIDRLRVDVEDTSEHRLVGVRVTYAVRMIDPVPPASSDSTGMRVLDAYVASLAAKDLFSGVVLVAHHGVPIYVRAFGESNKARHVAITEKTQFNLASMNKMFTAVSIMQLVEQGVLGLDDRLGDLLPDEYGEGQAADIRVKHLLSHTSGFSMYGPSFVFSPPGSSFSYANFGYLVLGQVVEAKTGMRFEDWVQLNIFGPLDMANTERYELTGLNPWVPWGYYYPIPAVDDRLERIPNKYLHIYTGGPMGGMYSTVGDLLKFANALREGRLVSPATLALMRAPKPELGAPEYGFGVMHWRAPGVWGHSGRLPGADADLEFYENDYIGIVLANYDQVNEPVLRTIRALFHQR